MIFQYIVPILIVTVAHARICNKLKYRMVNHPATNTVTASAFQKRKSEREAKRKRKTNTLLLMIAVVFSCSWMPLNVFNIMADFNGPLLKLIDKKGLVFPVCHLLVLSSACTNPVLYGWLNENFRREFINVLCSPCCRNFRVMCSCMKRSSDTSSTSSVVIYTKAHNGNSMKAGRQPLIEETQTFELTGSVPKIIGSIEQPKVMKI